MKRFSRPLATLAVLVLAACLIGHVFYKIRQVDSPEAQSMLTPQHADAPLGYPVSDGNSGERIPPFDPRFIRLSAYDRVRIPVIKNADYPMGTKDAGLTYNAQSYGEPNQSRGGKHSGDDLNGIGGQNSDLGDSVFSIADGLVIYSAKSSPGWGHTVIIAHRSPEGKIFQSFYSHLLDRQVSIGRVVTRGMMIGHVGNADGRYLAHLHFELRDMPTVDPALRGYYEKIPATHIDPSSFVAARRDSRKDLFAPQTSQIIEALQITPNGLQQIDLTQPLEEE